MKTVGIVGGIAPESTIVYYRSIIERYRGQKKDGSYPSILINSIDLSKMLGFVEVGDMAGLTTYLAGEIEKLTRAGADFGLLASNTPHIVFDEVRRRAPIPMISLVESTCDAVQALGLKCVGLFGTRFTMQGRFYPDVFSKSGIELVLPGPADQEYIHDKYMNELVNGVFQDETRRQLLAIVDRIKEQEGIEGLILGGTELPLLLKEAMHNGVPFLDTTSIHVDRVIRELLS